VPFLCVLTILGLLLFGINSCSNSSEARKAARQAQEIANRSQSMPLPTGFAAMCVDLWMTAGGDEGASQRFIANCNPGVEEAALSEQTPEAIQPQSTYAIGAPLSYTDENNPTLSSILVATRLREWKQYKGKEGSFADRGLAYFRVAVAINPKTGRQSLRGLPRLVAAPVDEKPEPLTDKLQLAQLSDARIAMIETFLQRLLIEPPADNPRQGDVTNYLWPDTSVAPVHSPKIKKVEVQQAVFTPDIESATEVRALVQAKITYVGGNALVQQYPMVLGRQGKEQWLVKQMSGAPALGEEK
jgi:hypothetical protein